MVISGFHSKNHKTVIQSNGINFFKGTLADAKAKAKEENKVLFIDAYTSWCGPCKRMSKNVFTDANVGKYFNDNFINLKIDIEQDEDGPYVARKYNVSFYPSLIFIKPDGSLIKLEIGYKDSKAFLKLGKSIEKTLN